MVNEPSTNNYIESLHGKIKKSNKLRQQVMVGEYIDQVTSLIRDWSQLRNPSDFNIRICSTYDWY